MKTKVLFIAPYRGLKELALSLIEGYPYLDMIVKEADLSEALPLIKFYEQEGIDFIISRGGTANLIKQYTTVPVIEVKVSGYDIIRALTLIKDYKMKVHMIGFPNICEGVVSIAHLMNLGIDYTTIHHEGEVKDAVRDAQQNGAQVILGDTITVKTAQQFGLQGMMITSGKESILDALDQVVEMNKVIYSIYDKTSVYKSMLENHTEPTAILDKDEKLVFHNHAFLEFLDLENTEFRTPNFQSFPELKAYFKNLMKNNESENYPLEVIKLKNKKASITGGSFLSGNKLYFYIILHNDKKYLKNGNGIKVNRNHLFPISFAQIVSNSKKMEKVLQKAKQVSNSRHDIVILGEKGTGKRFIAHSIHTESEFNKGDFIEVLINSQEYQGLQKVQDLFYQLEKGTLYVKGFEFLSNVDQAYFISQKKNNPNIRLIFSFEQNQLLGQSHLHHHLNFTTIELPPLRERPEDLEEFTRIFIALYNTRYGKQIVGLRSGILNELKTWHWPNNVSELKRVIKRLVKVTNGDYIEKDHLELIQSDDHTTTKNEGEIDLSKTLAEIEKGIILHVLQEENMNQTRAAKRLGINRTTLWRKLK